MNPIIKQILKTAWKDMKILGKFLLKYFLVFCTFITKAQDKLADWLEKASHVISIWAKKVSHRIAVKYGKYCDYITRPLIKHSKAFKTDVENFWKPIEPETVIIPEEKEERIIAISTDEEVDQFFNKIENRPTTEESSTVKEPIIITPILETVEEEIPVDEIEKQTISEKPADVKIDKVEKEEKTIEFAVPTFEYDRAPKSNIGLQLIVNGIILIIGIVMMIQSFKMSYAHWITDPTISLKTVYVLMLAGFLLFMITIGNFLSLLGEKIKYKYVSVKSAIRVSPLAATFCMITACSILLVIKDYFEGLPAKLCLTISAIIFLIAAVRMMLHVNYLFDKDY